MSIKNTLVHSTTTQIFSAVNSEQAITTMFFCNTSPTISTTLNLFLLPVGGAAGPSTQVIKSLSLPATETFVFDAEKIILENGESVWAQAADDNIVIATISSVQTS